MNHKRNVLHFSLLQDLTMCRILTIHARPPRSCSKEAVCGDESDRLLLSTLMATEGPESMGLPTSEVILDYTQARLLQALHVMVGMDVRPR